MTRFLLFFLLIAFACRTEELTPERCYMTHNIVQDNMGRGAEFVYELDENGRPVSVNETQQIAGNVNEFERTYEYDSHGHLIEIIHESRSNDFGKIRVMIDYVENRVVRITDTGVYPREEVFTYNHAGQLVKSVLGGSSVTEYFYTDLDAKNANLIKYPGGSYAELQYDDKKPFIPMIRLLAGVLEPAINNRTREMLRESDGSIGVIRTTDYTYNDAGYVTHVLFKEFWPQGDSVIQESTVQYICD